MAKADEKPAETPPAKSEPAKAAAKPSAKVEPAKADAKPAAKPAAEAKTSEEPKRRRRRRTPAQAETAAQEAGEAKAAEAAEESAAAAKEAPEPEAKTVAPARARPAAPVAEPNGLDEVVALRKTIEEQRALLTELRGGMASLERELKRAGNRPRLGVFVDVPNLLYGQEPDDKPINVGKLLDYISEGRELVRATAYSPVSDDPSEPVEHQKFVAPFVPYEYRIVTKPLKRFADGSIKGNFDVEMAIDMITMADRLDVVAIVSGDADFARAVEVVQSRGVRVEVVAFGRSTSLEMRALADYYVELAGILDKLR